MKATREDYKLLGLLLGVVFIGHLLIDLWYLAVSNG